MDKPGHGSASPAIRWAAVTQLDSGAVTALVEVDVPQDRFGLFAEFFS